MIWRDRFRVGSRNWRDRRRRTSAIWRRVMGGQMASRKAAAMRQVSRQMDLAREAVSSGGRFGHFGRGVVDQQGEEEVSSYPGLGEVWILGRQAVEMEDGFQPFEGELDLPADTIECGEQLGWKGGCLERG